MIMPPIQIINEWQYASTADIVDTNGVTVAAAPGAGKRHRVTGIHVTNTDATAATVVNLRSGSTVIWSGFVANFVTAAPGSTVDGEQFHKPLIGGDNEAISVICETTSAQVRVSVQGVTTV